MQSIKKTKRSKAKAVPRLQSLADKASTANGYALEKETTLENTNPHSRKRKRKKGGMENGKSREENAFATPKISRDHRTFRDVSNISAQRSFSIATPAYIQKHQSSTPGISGTTSTSRSSKSRNPYAKDRYAPPSSAKPHRHVIDSTHVVCAISENLARETCLTTIDAGSPVVMEVNKIGNGQMYAETVAFLEMLAPHEILLNEGRKNSQLCKKILAVFGDKSQWDTCNDGDDKRSDGNDEDGDVASTSRNTKLTGACPTKTVIKFVPRSYYDQNRGAELLRRIAREGSYDASIVEEYILLSSSYAVLQYLQICLGANFARNSLDISLNWGGKNRMAIDRSSITHLELLANAKTGKSQNSLIGTIDNTKTSVGSRLLRANLVSPPTRIDTINARLDLVDTFLEDEQFFYEVFEQLYALPDVERMLSHLALVPRKKGGSRSLFGDKRKVTFRMASKGISALVCIKSALAVIPNFARVLEIQLKSLVRKGTRKNQNQTAQRMDGRKTNNLNNEEDEDKDGSGGDSSDDETDSQLSGLQSLDESSTTRDEDESATITSSLLLGLGGGPSSLSRDCPRHQLLKAILTAMKNPALQEVLTSITDIFTESTAYTKNAHAMKHQECFALKPNTDGMMDVLRKALLANVDDIYKLADEYAETNGFSVTVKETAARGYYLSIPMKSMTTDLPPNFIQPVKTGRFINCTTEEVLSLSSRAQENVQDLLLMTHDRIQEVIDKARQKYDALASLSDAIALIDMCHSFADNVASSRLPWCRPSVTDFSRLDSSVSSESQTESNSSSIVGSGSIAIRNGRYGINVGGTGLMASNRDHGEFIPNDTYASAFQNFTIITGINGSGKSTYLKQLAITVILAHCGSYVPAEEAHIPVRDRLCTRIGTSDDQEHNISTFMQEMKDTAFICRNATDKSLILIDELGRATSNEDGVAIAWAIGEFLLIKRAMTFFVTHYPQLCRLADVYPNVQNQHLGATAEEISGEVRYMHKILPGPCQMSADYGVEMAATCGWQQDVVEMARQIRSEVENKLPDEVLCQRSNVDSNVDLIAVRHRAESILNDLAKHLVALKASEGRLNDHARRSYIQDLQNQYSNPDDSNVVKMMKNLLLDNSETSTPRIPLHPEGLSCLRASESFSYIENGGSNEVGVPTLETVRTNEGHHQYSKSTEALAEDSKKNHRGRDDEALSMQSSSVVTSASAFDIDNVRDNSRVFEVDRHILDSCTSDVQQSREDRGIKFFDDDKDDDSSTSSSSSSSGSSSSSDSSNSSQSSSSCSSSHSSSSSSKDDLTDE